MFQPYFYDFLLLQQVLNVNKLFVFSSELVRICWNSWQDVLFKCHGGLLNQTSYFRLYTLDSELETSNSRLKAPDSRLQLTQLIKSKEYTKSEVYSLESEVSSLESGVWYRQILNISRVKCIVYSL